MRDYELVLVVKPDGGDDGFTATVERFSQAIKDQGGEVTSVDPWGLRKLAYPIQRHMEGFYSVTAFKIEPVEVRALEDSLGRAEDVLRHLVVRQDEAPVVAESTPVGDESPQAEAPAAEASPESDEAPVAEAPAAEATSVGDESPQAEAPAAEATSVGDESPQAEAPPKGDEAPVGDVAAETEKDNGDVGA